MTIEAIGSLEGVSSLKESGLNPIVRNSEINSVDFSKLVVSLSLIHI